MNNLFSKSTGTYEKLVQQLQTILDNQRGERMDLARMNNMLVKIYNSLALQKQVDEYFEENDHPGTDLEDK